MSSVSVEELAEEVKKHTRGVLLSKIGGVPLLQFEKDYRELVGTRFPYRELGFSNTRSCLEAMSDTVRFEFSEPLQKMMLFGIADDHSFMSSAAIKAQFTPDKPVVKRKKVNKKKQSSDSDDSTSRRVGQKSKASPRGAGKSHSGGDQPGNTHELRPNLMGLYTVCVARLPPECELEILQLFSETASSEESSRGGSHFFLRYKCREDAEDVISRFNNYRFGDMTLNVAPAKEKMVVREKNRSQSSRPKEPNTRESLNLGSGDTTAQEPRAKPLGLDEEVRASGNSNKARKQQGPDKSSDKTQKGGKPQASSNRSRTSKDLTQLERGEADGRNQLPYEESTLNLPWKQTSLPNGNVAGSHKDETDISLKRTHEKFKSSASSNAVDPTTSTLSNSFSNRTIPKPMLPSILDLESRFKGAKI